MLGWGVRKCLCRPAQGMNASARRARSNCRSASRCTELGPLFATSNFSLPALATDPGPSLADCLRQRSSVRSRERTKTRSQVVSGLSRPSLGPRTRQDCHELRLQPLLRLPKAWGWTGGRVASARLSSWMCQAMQRLRCGCIRFASGFCSPDCVPTCLPVSRSARPIAYLHLVQSQRSDPSVPDLDLRCN
jgi:hypothetical protein